MKKTAAILSIAAALAGAGSAHASPHNGTWLVQACPQNRMIRRPCFSIVERNYGQAVVEARYLNSHGWVARAVRLG